jgi:hypothetical protein
MHAGSDEYDIERRTSRIDRFVPCVTHETADEIDRKGCLLKSHDDELPLDRWSLSAEYELPATRRLEVPELSLPSISLVNSGSE